MLTFARDDERVGTGHCEEKERDEFESGRNANLMLTLKFMRPLVEQCRPDWPFEQLWVIIIRRRLFVVPAREIMAPALRGRCHLLNGDVKPLTPPQIIRSSKKIPRDECFRPPQGFIL